MELRDDDFYGETELGWEMLGLKRAHGAFIAQNTSDNYVDLKSAAALTLYNGDISNLKHLPRALFNEGFPVAAPTSAQPVAIPRDIA